MGKGIYIFDYDGTLFDTLTADAFAFNETLKFFSLPPLSEEEMTDLIGYTVEDIARRCLDTSSEGLIAEFSDIFTDFEVEATLKHGKLYDGIPFLLEKLYGDGFIMEICSYGNKRYLDANILKFNLNRYFYQINTADSNMTKSQLLKHSFEKHNASFGVMIGDRKIDIDSGKANEFITVGASYGFGKGEIGEADYIAECPHQLLDILQSIRKEHS
jgi:phosphoglycolate phosphatase